MGVESNSGHLKAVSWVSQEAVQFRTGWTAVSATGLRAIVDEMLPSPGAAGAKLRQPLIRATMGKPSIAWQLENVQDSTAP